jgi:hypothetical protein
VFRDLDHFVKKYSNLIQNKIEVIKQQIESLKKGDKRHLLEQKERQADLTLFSRYHV